MWNDELNSLFRNGAIGSLKGKQLPVPVETIVDDVIAQFEPNREAEVASEMVRFMEWLKTWRYQGAICEVDQVTVTLVVPAQDGAAIHIALTAHFPVDPSSVFPAERNQKEINVYTATMFRQCMEAYKSLNLPEVRKQTNGNSQSHAQPTNGQAQATETELGTSIVVSVGSDGKKQYRIRAGRWSKFGIAVYSEVLNKTGTLWETWGAGEYPLNRKVTYALGTEGKPTKVISIE